MTEIKTVFKVFPQHTNHQQYNESGNVIFGGVAMSQSDAAAAIVTSMVLRDSETADYAVTWHCDHLYHRPVGVGDIIEYRAKLISLNGTGYNKDMIKKNNQVGRTLEIEVDGYHINHKSHKDPVLFSNSRFTFVAKRGNGYQKHGL